jgi:hypothetical protein
MKKKKKRAILYSYVLETLDKGTKIVFCPEAL